MADVKWIKITTDIFDDEKIILIESLPDAYAIITVWFKLLCLAGKQNNSGVFMMGRVAYTDKMLATIFRMKESTVTMALQTFEQFGMVEIIDGVITIPNWDKHQSLDQLEQAREQTRRRVAKHREKQRLLAGCNVTSNVTVTQCNADRIEEDTDTDTDKDTEKKSKRKRAVKETALTLFDRLYSEYILSDTLIEKIKEWLTYKQERNEDYTEQGLKSLLRRIENKYLEHKKNDKSICELIEECMSNGWKGIIFDRLKPPEKESSFDVDDFFEAAIRRTYDENPKPVPPRTALERATVGRMAENAKNGAKTAADDPELQKRVEELKNKIAQGG